MVVVRLNLLPCWARPISKKIFGDNKTYRGFVAMMLLSVLGVYGTGMTDPLWPQDLPVRFSDVDPWAIGLALGLGYALAELPNSLLKRALGIPPGKSPQRHRWLFVLMDQADSGFGCALAYGWVLDIPLRVLAVFLILGTVIHLVINFCLFLLGLRKEPV